MDKVNLQVIRESFGRVVYSHKTHEKNAEIEIEKAVKVKWINIILTTLTAGTLVSTIITNELILIYISTILSSLTLAFTIFQLSFNPEEKAAKHRQVAKELWFIREKYTNLIADIVSEKLNTDEICHRRDELTKELSFVYKSATDTTSKAYGLAREALKVNEELTFSDEEIDHFLPEELKSKN
jgi:hypothetical protein